MAKAKRQRRNSIRTMGADSSALDALDALESLERAERAQSPGEREEEPAAANGSATTPVGERDAD